MSTLLGVLSVVQLGAAGVCFALGIRALGGRDDAAALYWLAMGALVLRSAAEMTGGRRRTHQ